MTDTRKDKRAPVSLKVRFKSATVDEFAEQYCRDISRGGIFIKSKAPLPIGTLLKFEFQLKDESRVIHGVGRVVWKRSPDESTEADAPPGMGIKFIKMDSESRALVERIVSNRGGGPAYFESGSQSGDSFRSIPAATYEGGSGASFFPSTTPQAELPLPEDRTQVRHASEFLASALAGAGADETAAAEAAQKADEARKKSDEIERKRAAEFAKRTSAAPDVANMRANVSARPEPPQPEARRAAPPSPAASVSKAPPASTVPPTTVTKNPALPPPPTASIAPAVASEPTPPPQRSESARPIHTQTQPLHRISVAEALAQAASPEAAARVNGASPSADASPASAVATAPVTPPRASAISESRIPRPHVDEPQVFALESRATRAPRSGTAGRLFGVVLLVLLVGVVAYFATQKPAHGPSPVKPAASSGQTRTASTPPVATPPSTPTPQPAASPTAPTTPPDQVPTPAPTAETVSVRVESAPPGADVQIEGKSFGKTPLQVFLVPGRSVLLRLSAPGRVPIVRPVTPSAGGAPLRFSLTRMSYFVQVTSDPSGAYVGALGRSMQAPGVLDLGPIHSQVAVIATKSGYSTAKQTIPLGQFHEENGQMRAQISFTLTPLARPTPTTPVPSAPAPSGTTPTPEAQPSNPASGSSTPASSAPPTTSTPAPAAPAPTKAPPPSPAPEANPPATAP